MVPEDTSINIEVYEQKGISIVKYRPQNMYEFQWEKETLQ